MEEIDTALGVGEVLPHAVVDPPCPVAGHHLYVLPLLGRQELAELLEDGLAVVLVDPDDPVPPHVVDDGDVPVAH